MSHAALLLLFAIRLLLKSKFTFVLLTAAVAFGVGFQIPNAANLAGYSRELLNQGMKRATGHVTVTGKDGVLQDADVVIPKIEALPSVRHTAPRLIQAALLRGRGQRIPVRLVGIELERERRATSLCERVASGGCITRPSSEVLVGSEAAKKAELRAGDAVEIAVATPDASGVVKLPMNVAGILRGGGAFQEDNDVIAVRGAVVDPLADDGAITALLVYGDSAEQADQYRDDVRRILPSLDVKSWRDSAGFVNQAIEGNRKLTWVSLLMVTCAVLVPVLALSYIHVTAERRQIGTLRAVGMTRLDILAIYLLKSAIVTLVGTSVGVGLGMLLCWYFQLHPLFNSDGFVVRPSVSVAVVASSIASVGLTTIIAGLWPAMRAAMTSPIEELTSS
jgi:putative ABC transport system permease protein